MTQRYSGPATTIACGEDLDTALQEVPAQPAVFAVWSGAGEPYIARSGDLRRRLLRLLRKKEGTSRLLNLRSVATRVDYWPTASRLESSLVLYECARQHLPETYLHLLRLRIPFFVRLLAANPFPRLQVMSHLTSSGLSYGPFRTRALAEQFEHQLLDLYQVRRCQEDLTPSPDHPGCIYGEMNRCLRPCQAAVSADEYASEANRVAEFLRSDGRSALAVAEASRDRLSAELEFEGAAREHERVARIENLLRLKDDLARESSRLCGVAVTPAREPGTASLWLFLRGVWQKPALFGTEDSGSTSMDKRLRNTLESIEPQTDLTTREKEEHLAILARWYWSSWRDGLWIPCESFEKLSYRRLVSAVSKVVHESTAAASDAMKKGTASKEP